MSKTIIQPQFQLLQGNQALALGMIKAGLTFFAGYPITPANGIAETLAREMPKVGRVFIQMEDEIASIAAVIGASLTGACAATATSGPGFSLMQENIGFAAAVEVPCVIVDVQRAGPSTGFPSRPGQGDIMQARWGTHGDHPIIALYPSSVLESYTIAGRAFDLAWRYRTPVIILSDGCIGEAYENVPTQLPLVKPVENLPAGMPPEWYHPYDNQLGDVPPMIGFGSGYRWHATGLFHDINGFPTQRLDEIRPWLSRLFNKIDRHHDDIVQVEEFEMHDADVAIIAYGVTARSAKSTVRLGRKQGLKVGLLRPITIWPFPKEQVQQLSYQVNKIVVAEMNNGQYVLEVERVVGGRCQVVKVAHADGELISPEEILSHLEV